MQSKLSVFTSPMGEQAGCLRLDQVMRKVFEHRSRRYWRVTSARLGPQLAVHFQKSSWDASLVNFWRPFFGQTYITQSEAAWDPQFAAALYLLETGLSNSSGDCRFDFDRNMQVTFLGSKISNCRSLYIAWDKNSIQIDATEPTSRRTYRYFNKPRFIAKENSSELPALMWIELGKHRLFVQAAEDVDEYGSYFGISSLSCLALHRCKLAEALDLIRTYAPSYIDWVGRSIRFIVPFESDNGAMVSGSNQFRPGEINICTNVTPVQLAEMLVHEASHQHLYMLMLLGKLTMAGEGEFYNPILKRDRPLSKILLAQHAFGNTILFLQECLANGFQGGKNLSKYIQSLKEEVDTLSLPLAGARLTQLGRTAVVNV